MNYEDEMKELEQIIAKLESGEAKFDEAIGLFEKGANLCQSLNTKFNDAKGRITVIKNTLGALIEEDLQ